MQKVKVDLTSGLSRHAKCLLVGDDGYRCVKYRWNGMGFEERQSPESDREMAEQSSVLTLRPESSEAMLGDA